MGTNIFHSCFSISNLVLVDSVLQWMTWQDLEFQKKCRNPCFSGQCFAIILRLETRRRIIRVTILVLVDSVLQSMRLSKEKEFEIRHNPCFSGQCFAMTLSMMKLWILPSHNPCFSGQCFAIVLNLWRFLQQYVTILVLVDSVLQ